MKYNVIGDIHGRRTWENLVINDGINIFVGDYFAPYVFAKPGKETVRAKTLTEFFESMNDERDTYSIPYYEVKKNFLNIIKYKEEHPETILLLGNHDLDHWYIPEKTRGWDGEHYLEISSLFEQYKDYFKVCHSINNKILLSHAGVSIVWYMNKVRGFDFPLYPVYPNELSDGDTFEEAVEKYKTDYIEQHQLVGVKPSDIIKKGRIAFYKDELPRIYDGEKWIILKFTPDEVCSEVNKLWDEKKYEAFTLYNNKCTRQDYWGESPTLGPLWIRNVSLLYCNIFRNTDYIQIVGHTHTDGGIIEYNDYTKIQRSKIICTDCLDTKAESCKFEI